MKKMLESNCIYSYLCLVLGTFCIGVTWVTACVKIICPKYLFWGETERVYSWKQLVWSFLKLVWTSCGAEVEWSTCDQKEPCLVPALPGHVSSRNWLWTPCGCWWFCLAACMVADRPSVCEYMDEQDCKTLWALQQGRKVLYQYTKFIFILFIQDRLKKHSYFTVVVTRKNFLVLF